jgi:hypothetical protein
MHRHPWFWLHGSLFEEDLWQDLSVPDCIRQQVYSHLYPKEMMLRNHL